MKIQDLVNKLGLKPLWGEDYLVEFYSSPVVLSEESLSKEFDGERSLFTWAYYLLPERAKCPLHMMYADESWQYCSGGPMNLYMISPSGQEKVVTIGPDIQKGHSFIYIVPAGWWFGSVPCSGSEYTLVTHAVSPGFQPQDWEKGYAEYLLEKFPQSSGLIQKLSWPKPHK